MTGRWTKTTGGSHFCATCREFVEATIANPVWVFVTGNVSTNATCSCCADEVAA